MIYVDNRRIRARVSNGSRVIYGVWSHLFAFPADDKALIRFARKLGLRSSWIQRGSITHFDVTESMRQKALAAGAEFITARDAAIFARSLRKRPEDGK